MTESQQIKNMCSKCIESEEFALWIRNNGRKGICDFNSSHGLSNKIVPLDDFIAYVDEWFRENYRPGGEYRVFIKDSDKAEYKNYGSEYRDILLDELQCDPNIVDAIARILKANNDYEDPAYDEGMHYESVEEYNKREEEEFKAYYYENKTSFQWEEFCESVKYKRRFIKIKELLDDLFGEAEKYSEGKRRPIYEFKSGAKIYRARKLVNGLTRDIISKNPTKELGSPPIELTTPGRMNFQSIPVFYGAFSSDLALIETQPYISENIAVGEFTIIQDIKVFDFTIYDKIHDDLYQAEERSNKYTDTRYGVISDLQTAIRKPISRHNPTLEYIPTQTITEYIKEHFKVDAIIFFSSLISPESEYERRNIVLFTTSHLEKPLENYLVLNTSKIIYKEVTGIKYDIIDDIDDSPL